MRLQQLEHCNKNEAFKQNEKRSTVVIVYLLALELHAFARKNKGLEVSRLWVFGQGNNFSRRSMIHRFVFWCFLWW